MLGIKYRDNKDKGRESVEWDVVQVMVNASGLAQKVSIFEFVILELYSIPTQLQQRKCEGGNGRLQKQP